MKLAVVFGVHRSGTSVVSKSLESVGFRHTETLMPGERSNPKGYFEDLELVAFNERLFRTMNTSWKIHQSKFEKITSDPEVLNEARRLIRDKVQTHRNLVLKDPRFSQLMPFWKNVFDSLEDISIFYIHVIRNPFDVANSLHKRDGLTINYWLNYWYFIENQLKRTLASENQLIIETNKLLKDPDFELERVAAFASSELSPNSAIEFKENFIDHRLFNLSHPVSMKDTHPATVLYQELIAGPTKVDLAESRENTKFESEFWIKTLEEVSSHLILERDQIATERDQIATERDQIATERDSLRTQNAGILSSRTWRWTKLLRRQ